jgi:small-conductance mechanosensitive channel
MSETFTFDVGYSTTFEDLERLREKMLEFVTKERRDYDTVFDVKVKGKLFNAVNDLPEPTTWR